MFIYRDFLPNATNEEYPYSPYKIPSARISYTQNGVDRVEYTNNPTTLERIFTDNPGYTNVIMEPFAPSEEQLSRLNFVNSNEPMNDEIVDNTRYERERYIMQLSDFVQYGYIDFTAPGWLLLNREEYNEVSKEYIMSVMKKRISTMKKEKLLEHCTFREHIVKTDEETRNAISATLTNLMAGVVEKVNFKTMSGWLELDLEGMKELAKRVNLHTQSAFSAESLAVEILNELDVDLIKTIELISIVKSGMSVDVEKSTEMFSLSEIYNGFFELLEKEESTEDFKNVLLEVSLENDKMTQDEITSKLVPVVFTPIVDRVIV